MVERVPLARVCQRDPEEGKAFEEDACLLDGLLRKRELAKLLTINWTTLDRWRREGKFPRGSPRPPRPPAEGQLF